MTETDNEGNSSETKELSDIFANSGISHEEEKASGKSKELHDKKLTSHQPKKAEQNADVVTFSRQKLVMLTCKHDASRCSQCGKLDSNLKRCSRCRTAIYFSRDCHALDWKSKHKIECREILRLKEIVPEGEVHEGCPGKEGKNELTKADNERSSLEVTELTRTLANSGIRNKEEKPAAGQPRKAEQNADMATFIRQRLALLECKHDASRCSQCGKSDGNLKRCSRCKTAVYCSETVKQRTGSRNTKLSARKFYDLKK